MHKQEVRVITNESGRKLGNILYNSLVEIHGQVLFVPERNQEFVHLSHISIKQLIEKVVVNYEAISLKCLSPLKIKKVL